MHQCVGWCVNSNSCTKIMNSCTIHWCTNLNNCNSCTSRDFQKIRLISDFSKIIAISQPYMKLFGIKQHIYTTPRTKTTKYKWNDLMNLKIHINLTRVWKKIKWTQELTFDGGGRRRRRWVTATPEAGGGGNGGVWRRGRFWLWGGLVSFLAMGWGLGGKFSNILLLVIFYSIKNLLYICIKSISSHSL